MALWRGHGRAAEVWAGSPSARRAPGRNLPPMTKHSTSNLPLVTLIGVIALWYVFGAALLIVGA